MYNTYIFDLDGTLLSTLGDLAASCNYALRTHHMPERTLDEVRRVCQNVQLTRLGYLWVME